MKTLRLKTVKNALCSVMKCIAVLFSASVLTTACSTGQTAALSETPPPEAYYQLTDDCALLHVYRPGSMAGAIVSYDLYLDEWKIFRVKNKSKTTLKITRPGTFTLWAKTETREEFPVEIQLGNEYYIRCGVNMGAFVGRPKIEMVYPQTGKYEFNKIPWKK